MQARVPEIDEPSDKRGHCDTDHRNKCEKAVNQPVSMNVSESGTGQKMTYVEWL